eukprot:CAMPEP_0185211188 /NCGR_PEP_ID=MMETSP1140-20130426/66900_1 /TAXON_ID=298111 /ORGANISM="Pavlova sp., Strain CCMP459" /LENGTH=255 /DNA_ID=CAMNT_0027779027 /DNA_START=38 /DNA_END=805 /DNA_ORIENTATION=+
MSTTADDRMRRETNLLDKRRAKIRPEDEQATKDWIQAVTGEDMSGSLQEKLQDGKVLCTLVNKIKPGTIKKVNESKMAFKQMENIKFFLDACVALGVPQTQLFLTPDLYEGKDMLQVMGCIAALGTAARKQSGFAGPHFGVASKAAPAAPAPTPVAAAPIVEEEEEPEPEPEPEAVKEPTPEPAAAESAPEPAAAESAPEPATAEPIPEPAAAEPTPEPAAEPKAAEPEAAAPAADSARIVASLDNATDKLLSPH